MIQLLSIALAATLLAANPAPNPLTPAELVATHPEPTELSLAMMKQCSLWSTDLACFIYQRKVHDLATPAQGMAIGQWLAPVATFVGRYRDAARFNPFNQRPDTGVKQPPLPKMDFRATDAAEVVSHLARDRHLVMINEYHMDASTRQLTLALLPHLYAEGFRYLAVEALSEDGVKFANRGYPVKSSGYYTREPVFADLLSQAAKLGYTLVSYDSHGKPEIREKAQAQNIFNKTFARDPTARVLVHAGHGHIGEHPGAYRGNVKPMAMQLHELSGFDPLTVDQTALRSHAPEHGSALYQALTQAYAPRVPTVLLNEQGNPWSTAPDTYDISVLMPVRSPGPGRSQWLSLGGTRQAQAIDPAWCTNTLPCEISAWPLHQPRDAIPSDTYALLRPDEKVALYLRPGHYRIQAHDSDGHLLTSHGMSVQKESQP